MKNKSTLAFILVLFTLRWSFADQYRVPTGSMEPNIHVGDHIAVNKMAYDLKLPFTNLVLMKTGEPKRGDIVVFKSPIEPGMTLVKRLIALPGDHVLLQNGEIEINGEKIKIEGDSGQVAYYEIWKDKKVEIQRNVLERNNNLQEFTVPEDSYFFMGDNRDNSYDSRYWGFVPRENIKGQAKFVLWNIALRGYLPFSEMDRFGHVF
jgi:signal peptidase I